MSNYKTTQELIDAIREAVDSDKEIRDWMTRDRANLRDLIDLLETVAAGINKIEGTK
jgi:hypothetical protein